MACMDANNDVLNLDEKCLSDETGVCHVSGKRSTFYDMAIKRNPNVKKGKRDHNHLKDTSLISVTGLVEIMRQSYIAAGSTRDPLFFYSFAAVLYLVLTYFSMKLINRLEIKYSRGF